MLVPPLLNFLAHHPAIDKFDLSTLRLLVVGAAPVAPSLFKSCLARFAAKGIPLDVAYGLGMTETSGCVAHMGIDPEDDCEYSVGPLLPGMEGRIVDDKGDDTPEGVAGELWLRGPNIMKSLLRCSRFYTFLNTPSDVISVMTKPLRKGSVTDGSRPEIL